MNAAVTNPAFINKNQDDQMSFVLDFISALPANGGSVLNIQKNINALASTLGIPTNQVYNYVRAWATSNFGASGDTNYERIEAIDAAFGFANGLYSFRSGRSSLAITDDSLTVTFTNAFSDNDYVIEWSVENTLDPAPIQLQGQVTSRLSTGFTITLSAETDSANYVIHWTCRRPQL